MINTGPAADGLAKELAALEAVGRALAQLEDTASRARVLHWAIERFDAARPSAPALGEHPGDPTLAVDDLNEMFDRAAVDDDDGLVVAPVERRAPRWPDAPLDSLVQSFAVDLRRVGQEWQRA